MSETRPYVAWELINDFMVDVFKAYGVPEADAAICADVLLESDRRGIESHGCNRFKPIYLDRIKNGTLLPVTNCEIVKETPTTVVMDAHNGMGMVASHKMMEMTRHLEIVSVDIISIIIDNNKIVMLSVYLIILFEYIS
jgi:LDH2 family malate/lactate/ureidoglycolate dehydrogenase